VSGRPLLGEACALAAALSWSSCVVLFKRSEAVSPLGMNLFKNVSSLLLLAATMPVLGLGFDASRSGADWARLVLSGVLGVALADTLVFVALRRLGAGLFAVVDCVYAPLIVVLSVGFLGERLNAGFAAGAALVVLGVLSASSERGAPQGAPARGALAGGVVIGVAAIATMGVGVVLAKPVLERGHLVEVTLVRMIAAVAAQSLWVAAVPSARPALTALRPSPAWRTLVPASFLGSYVALLLWLGGFKWAAASRAAVLNQMSTVFTIVMARLVLQEPVSRRRALGAAAALIGALLVILLE
jgi:drug/metabolite transporter (DMT)-like permease